METTTVYFEKPGRANTIEVLRLARRRAEQLGIGQVVLATTHGYTALQAAEVFRDSRIQLIAVSISAAFDEEGWIMTPSERENLEGQNVRVLTSLHGLADGVAEGFLGAHTPGTVMADTLRCFSQGMKVAVEVSIMAAEAGWIAPGRETIALGGTSDGADTAVVLRPAFARKIKELKICEVLCKPRLSAP
jgi:hypothetical protein